MSRLAARLLLLIAMLLAPLSMTAAPAEPMEHGAGMPMQHCPDQQALQKNSGIADCAMACAAALPAGAAQQGGIYIVAHRSDAPSLSARLTSRHLEIATPPPKVA